MAIDPGFVSKGLDMMAGVGSAKLSEIARACKTCREEFIELHVHVRRCGYVPCQGNLSKGFFLDKGTGAPGLAGQRLLHVYCAYWRSFFGSLVVKGLAQSKHEWPPWCDAYLPHRRREGL